MQQNNEPVNALIVQQRFYGINPNKKAELTILQVIQDHNDEAEKLIGKDFSGTHNFASDYPTHLANARRYQRARNARNIC